MFYFWGIIMPIISGAGLVGNILTMIVLFRKEMQSTTVYFLRTLVVTDTGIIIGATLGLSVLAITQRDPHLWYFTHIIFPRIYMPVNYSVMTLQFLNVWTTVAVSVERYIAICHPFSHFKICKRRNALIILGTVSVISVIYNLPRCFATTYHTCGDNCEQLVSTEFGKSRFYVVYNSWLYMILVFIIPLLLLIVLNTLLIFELMRMRKRRMPTNSQENTEINLSCLLVLVVIVFIFCQTPGLIAQFYFLDSTFLLKWMCVSNTLFVLNSSVNFIIYVAVGKKFRSTFFKLFKLHKKSVRGRSDSRACEGYSQTGVTELNTFSSSETRETDDNSDESCALNGRTE
jgi:hypothetical protein